MRTLRHVLLACCLVVGLGLSAAPASTAAARTSPADDAAKVVGTAQVLFQATGSYHIDWDQPGPPSTHNTGDVQLHLRSTFDLDVLKDEDGVSSLEPSITGRLRLTDVGTLHYTEDTDGRSIGGNHSWGTCDIRFPVPDSMPLPKLTAAAPSGGDVALQAQSLTRAAGIDDADDYGCPRRQGYDGLKMAPELWVGDAMNESAPLPTALTARVRLPVDALEDDGTTVLDARSTPVSGTCGTSFGMTQGCTQSLSWAGSVTVTVKLKTCKEQRIGSVTTGDGTPLSAAGRAAAGLSSNSFTPGQQISAPAGKAITINMTDSHGHSTGGLTLGPGATVSVPDDCDGFGQPPDVTLDFILKKGETWLRHTLMGDRSKFEVSPERAIAGTRGSSYTLAKDPKTHQWLMHVIEGDGYAGLPHHRLIDVPAGRGVLLAAKGPRLSDRWPTAHRRLVPPKYRPAVITRLALSGTRHGSPHAKLRFRLDRKATVLVRVFRGHKVVAHKKVHAHAGTATVHPYGKHLRKGHYRVALTVTTPQRAVSLAGKAFTVR